MRAIFLLALAFAAVAAAPVAAAPPLAAYGDLPTIEQVAISPSGRLLALDVVKGEARTIVVQDLVARKIVNGVRAWPGVKLRGMEWAGDDHLILISSFTGGAVDLMVDTTEWFQAADFNLVAKKLTPLLGDANLSLNTIEGAPEIRTIGGRPCAIVEGVYFGGQQQDSAGGVRTRFGQLALFKIDLDSDRSTLLAADELKARKYIVDADGEPLAESIYDGLTKQWRLKVWRDRQWRPAQAQQAAIETPYLVGLGRDGRSIVVHGLGSNPATLREVSPDGAVVGDPLPGPSSGAAVFDPATHRLIGMSTLEGDEHVYRFYDAHDDLAWRSILAAFPKQDVTFVSSSDDRSKLVLHLVSPTDGPGYALVDLANHSSQWLGSDYPQLTPADISGVLPVRFQASDGLKITGYLTLPRGREPENLPLVVFPHGGPAERDRPGFDWWAQAMASRGYAVLQVNYRGSAGLGWDFQQAGFGEWGRKMQTDLSDGVRYLATQGTIDPKRVCIVGASYGGYAALAGATLDQGVYRCAVDVSGPADLAKLVAWGKVRDGDGGLAGQRYWLRYMGAENLGDAHLAAISPADLADKVTIPILIVHGKDDTVVPFAQSQLMADALARAGKPYQFVVLNHEDHWLSSSDTRLQMLEATMDFLAKYNPPG